MVQRAVGLPDAKVKLERPVDRGFNMVPLVNAMAARQQQRMKSGNFASADIRSWDQATWMTIFGEAREEKEQIDRAQSMNWEKIAQGQALRSLDAGEVEQLLGTL